MGSVLVKTNSKVGYNVQEETPLVQTKSHRHSFSGLKLITTSRLCALNVAILSIVAVGSILILAGAQTLQISTPEESLELIAQNDSSLLGVYGISSHEKAVATMMEIVENEDAFHENYYTIVPSSKVLVHMELFKENHSIVPLVDDAVAVNQRYIYMLRNSTLKYTFCLGNGAKRSKSALYGFDDEEAYKNYIDLSLSSGSVFTKKFEIGGHGEMVCGNASFTSNKNGYYFFVLKTKYANTNVNYTIEAKLNRLSINDYLRKYSSCRVDQYKTSCSLSFDSSNKEWSLIGYSLPNFDINSHLNHVRVRIVKQRNSLWDSVYELLCYGGLGMVGGGFLFLIVFNVISFLILKQRSNHIIMQ